MFIRGLRWEYIREGGCLRAGCSIFLQGIEDEHCGRAVGDKQQ